MNSRRGRTWQRAYEIIEIIPADHLRCVVKTKRRLNSSLIYHEAVVAGKTLSAFVSRFKNAKSHDRALFVQCLNRFLSISLSLCSSDVPRSLCLQGIVPTRSLSTLHPIEFERTDSFVRLSVSKHFPRFHFPPRSVLLRQRSTVEYKKTDEPLSLSLPPPR